MNLFGELKRRNVFRIGIAYLIGSWLLLQVVDVVGPILKFPDEVARYVLFLLAIGFIPALILAWAFELTPDGVKLESEVDRSASVTHRTGRRLDRAIIVILVFAVGFLLYDKLSNKGSEPFSRESLSSVSVTGTAESSDQPVAVTASAKTVAVLPFVAMSNGPDDDYFSDGLTEEIINALAQLPDLMVTARTSAFHFKGQNLPIADIARELGVEHIVEGSVRRAGEQLRITAQLIRTSDGFHLWSQTYDRRTEDTFAVQSDIAEKVANALNVFLDDNLRARMQRAGTRNVEAFISFQKGMGLYERAHQEPDQISLLRQANIEFEYAIAGAPDMVEAYHYHSDLSSHILISQAAGELDGNITEMDVDWAPGSLTGDYQQTIRYAKNTNQLRNAEFGLALLTGQWQGLKQLSDQALSTDGCETALWAHLVGSPYGDAQLAKAGFSRMVRCDPLRVRAMVHVTGALLWMGKAEQAARYAEQSLHKASHPWLVRGLALALAFQGQTEQAMQVAITRFRVDTETLFLQAMISAFAGDDNGAESAATEYFALAGPNDRDALVFEAARGRRNEANRLATMIDARPFGHVVLLQAIYACMCGAPFELEATPRFEETFGESGLSWPPAKPYEFPLKNW
jgi:adenylate cyclase